jgi:CelD/BcsL family acetyltransferase involved in cellulose biosynthesis
MGKPRLATPPSGDSAIQYSVETVLTESGLDRLEADWNRLSEAAEHPNVFMTYGWYRAWCRRQIRDQSGGHFEPYVLVLKQAATVVGIAPFARRVAVGLLRVRKLEFVTYHSDYNDLVLGADPAEQSKAVMRFLACVAGQWDVIDFRDLRDTGDTFAHIGNSVALAGLSYKVLPEVERCPYMPIDKPWSEMMMQHSRSTRRAYRRFTDMKREGLRARIVENPQQEPGLLDQLIAVEAQKHVGGELSQPFLGIFPEVFQSLFDTLGPLGWIVVTLLEWKDRAVAWQILYRCGKSLWGYSTAYDHTFSSISPGTALVSEVVDYSLARGIEEFDFLRGSETYKMRWVVGFHYSSRLLIWNHRILSRLYTFAFLRFRVRLPATEGIERSTDRTEP